MFSAGTVGEKKDGGKKERKLEPIRAECKNLLPYFLDKIELATKRRANLCEIQNATQHRRRWASQKTIATALTAIMERAFRVLLQERAAAFQTCHRRLRHEWRTKRWSDVGITLVTFCFEKALIFFFQAKQRGRTFGGGWRQRVSLSQQLISDDG